MSKNKLTIGNGRKFEDSVEWNTKIWKFSCTEKKVGLRFCYSKHKNSLQWQIGVFQMK